MAIEQGYANKYYAGVQLDTVTLSLQSEPPDISVPASYFSGTTWRSNKDTPTVLLAVVVTASLQLDTATLSLQSEPPEISVPANTSSGTTWRSNKDTPTSCGGDSLQLDTATLSLQSEHAEISVLASSSSELSRSCTSLKNTNTTTNYYSGDDTHTHIYI